MIEQPSSSFDDRPAGAPVDVLVIHYTGMAGAEEALNRLCDPAARVSAHYLIDEDGTVIRLVDESRRAWHAGHAFWRGAADVNGRSIGIELVNPGHELGYRPFAEAQMRALKHLARGILSRHPIPPRNVVGHSDVAPRRKKDPGELFDWRSLARAGIGPLPPRHAAARGRAGTGGLLSVALSLGSPPPGVTRHRVPVEPGLSSPRTSGGPAAWKAATPPPRPTLK